MAKEPYLIKKYPNRRLYDTIKSEYITLEELKQLILDHIKIKVIDTKDDSDITRSCLIQVILEQEESGQPIFSTTTLENVIRFYGNPMQKQFIAFLNKSLDLFYEQQKAFKESPNAEKFKDPFAMMSKLTAMNMALWQEFWKDFNKNNQ